MKKLIEWVIGVNVLSVLWLSLLFNQHNKIINEYYFIIQFFPIIAIIAFGAISLTIILYRVATFNDCESAAMDLQAEIKEAKTALKQKGFKFD